MALARLLGFGALGCLYGGRLVNLLAYAALCYAALRTAHQVQACFFVYNAAADVALHGRIVKL